MPRPRRIANTDLKFTRIGEVGSGDYAVTYKGEAIPGMVRRASFRGREGGFYDTFGWDFGQGVEDWGYTRTGAAMRLVRAHLGQDA